MKKEVIEIEVKGVGEAVKDVSKLNDEIKDTASISLSCNCICMSCLFNILASLLPIPTKRGTNLNSSWEIYIFER